MPSTLWMPLSSAAPAVVMSFALTRVGRENVLQNAIAHTTDAMFIIHTSFGFKNDYGRIITKNPGRQIWINLHQLKIEHKNAPGVLAAHLSNFAMCEQSGLPCDERKPEHSRDVKFVFMASNSVLFRPGLESWVLRHSMSFCILNECSDFRRDLGPDSNAWDMRNWRTLLNNEHFFWSAQPPSKLYLRQQQRAVLLDDSTVAVDAWVAEWVALMRSGKAARTASDGNTWQTAPVNLAPHEGSFYPVYVLRDFVRRGLNGSAFEDSMHNSADPSLPGRRCPCCEMYKRMLPPPQPHRNGTFRELGNCGMVETLLPTYVWQHHAPLIATSSPTLISRVWGVLGKACNLTDADEVLVSAKTGRKVPATRVEAFVAHLRSAPGGHGHLYGLKFPRHEFNHLHNELRRVSGVKPQLSVLAHGTMGANGSRAVNKSLSAGTSTCRCHMGAECKHECKRRY